jgi:hypothetical protein
MRVSALRFLYKRTLKRSDLVFDDLIFPKVPHKLPTVLSQDEVVQLIDAAPNRDRVLTFYVHVDGPFNADCSEQIGA